MASYVHKYWKIIALIVIGLMFFSSIAFAVLQSVIVPQQNQQPEQTQLPVDYILDSKLTQAQYQLALDRGLTVMTYRYETNCAECSGERNLLEQVVLSKEFQGQVLLEEVVESSPTKLEITSFAGTKSLDKIETEEIARILCDLVISPPLACVGSSS